MKSLRSRSATVALLVLALSLVSSPVMPGEHPWDSDEAGGTGSAPTDSSQILGPTPIQRNYSTGETGWFTNLVSTISTQLTSSFSSIRRVFAKSGKSTSTAGSKSTSGTVLLNRPSE